MCSPSNILYIFTTNHIEKLDSALIRPGRIDLMLEIDLPCRETLEQFSKSFYNKGLPESIKNEDIAGNLSFAKLQTDVMREVTYDQFIESIMRKENV